MIVGNGDIASVLIPFDREDKIFFASGVSNSLEKKEKVFQREVDLLMKQDKTKRLIYFSSLSIFFKKSAYTEHKKKMEALVKLEFPNYTIIRLGNILWGSNPNTVINYFRRKIANQERLLIRDEIKHIISINEFRDWIMVIPDWNCEMNIPGQPITVHDLINEYCYVGQDLRQK